MCVIVPVDHLPCGHTTPLWQYCEKAARSPLNGFEHCGRIRQHARPILAPKNCTHCGGPRLFERRGGFVDRGARPAVALPQKEEGLFAEHDSGYHSDILEEEEDDDVSVLDDSISPHASPMTRPTQWSARRRGNTLMNQKPIFGSVTPSQSRIASMTRKPSWSPNLRQEFMKGQQRPSRARAATTSKIAQGEFEDDLTRVRRWGWQQPVESSAAPVRPGLGQRKGSSLLHPSSPEQTPGVESPVPTRPEYRRKSSTLLHPSSPPTATPVASPPIESSASSAFSMQRRNAFPFPFFASPTAVTPLSPESVTSTAPSLIFSASNSTASSSLETTPNSSPPMPSSSFNALRILTPGKPLPGTLPIKPTSIPSFSTKIWKDESDNEDIWPEDIEVDTDAYRVEEGKMAKALPNPHPTQIQNPRIASLKKDEAAAGVEDIVAFHLEGDDGNVAIARMATVSRAKRVQVLGAQMRALRL